MKALDLLSRSLGRAALVGVVGASVWLSTGTAHAQTAPPTPFSQRLSLRIEATVGGNGQAYRNVSDPGFNVGGAVRGGINILPILALQIGFSPRWFALDPNGQTNWTALGALGFRIQPSFGSFAQFFVDANGQVGGSALGWNFGIELGMGLEFRITDNVHLGPLVRYGRIFPANTALMYGDREVLHAGVVLAIRAPNPSEPTPVAPPDKDDDGVLDKDDQCVDTPKGEHPDPARPGCPLADTDSDGVFDNEDLCKDTPKGDHPDPARLGCPQGDVDNDGVFDKDDQCPTSPAGANPDPDKAGCPDGDDDADGVLNHTDQCRDVPAGLTPDPDKAGCPIPDRDHDSVPDSTDHCPDRPGAPSPDPNKNGCPGLVLIDHGQIRITQQIFFATNSSTILPQSMPVVQAVADALKASPQVLKVQIGGHTDDVGVDATNLTLSQNRANSVMAALVARGIDAGRLVAQGFGETRPITPVTPGMPAPAATAARSKNRRVEFVILDPPQQDAAAQP